MVKAAFDPRNISLYVEPRHLIHFEWQNSNKVYRYALVEIIDPKDINHRSKYEGKSRWQWANLIYSGVKKMNKDYSLYIKHIFYIYINLFFNF